MYLKFSLWLLVFTFTIIASNAQELPNTFKIGEYLEVRQTDSLKVYFRCGGSITKESCADYFRIGKISKTGVNFEGAIKDFYISGKKAFEGTIKNNVLVGKAVYYFKNGQISEEGAYLDDSRSGVWKYFYPNGKLEKVVNFIQQQPVIVTYFDSASVLKVSNGNGIFTGSYLYDNSCSRNTISGELKDGRMHGEWNFLPDGDREVFEEGKFIRGYSPDKQHIPNHYSNYTDFPRMKLSGFYPAENLKLDESVYCPFFKFGKGKPKEIYLDKWQIYRYNKTDFHRSFYPEFLNQLKAVLPKTASDQWLIIGLNIEKSGKLGMINVSSSIDDQAMEKATFSILEQFNKWDAPRSNKIPLADSHYFAVIVIEGQVYIPYLTIHQY